MQKLKKENVGAQATTILITNLERTKYQTLRKHRPRSNHTIATNKKVKVVGSEKSVSQEPKKK